MMFALNQGEVCTCPSRAPVQESIYDAFIERAPARVEAIRQGHPLDRHDDRRAGVEGAAREDSRLLRHRSKGGCDGSHRWRPGDARG